MKIGFIGMGNMAKAIAGGFVNSKKVAASDLYAYAPTKDKLINNSKEIGFNACDTAIDVVKASDIVILACKPYQIKAVLDEIGTALTGKALVSIAAGWTFKSFEDILGDKVMIQCIMPNTPAMVGEGVMLFEAKNSLTSELNDHIKDIFSALGIVEVLPTELMGIGGAISGCGPAFMDLMMESYADAGSAKLQQVSGSHPAVLKDAVCSPNGTTIRGVAALEKNGFRNACISSVDAIMDFKKNS